MNWLTYLHGVVQPERLHHLASSRHWTQAEQNGAALRYLIVCRGQFPPTIGAAAALINGLLEYPAQPPQLLDTYVATTSVDELLALLAHLVESGVAPTHIATYLEQLPIGLHHHRLTILGKQRKIPLGEWHVRLALRIG